MKREKLSIKNKKKIKSETNTFELSCVESENECENRFKYGFS
jgi:hypothetical protein